jgi:hypothetical protein
MMVKVDYVERKYYTCSVFPSFTGIHAVPFPYWCAEQNMLQAKFSLVFKEHTKWESITCTGVSKLKIGGFDGM